MSYADRIIAEFDPDKRILHLQAEGKLLINTEAQLDEVCSKVSSILVEHCAKERCYMVVNLSCFAIDPSLADAYGEKMLSIGSKFIYPEGIARYGYEITRVTVALSRTQHEGIPENLFATRNDAYAYIEGLIEENRKGNPHTRAKAS